MPEIVSDEVQARMLIDGTISMYSDSYIYSLPKYAFANCGELLSVSLPNVSTIESNCFMQCSKLSQFDFTGVCSVGQNAFQSCAFVSVDLKSAECVWEDGCLKNNDKLKFVSWPVSSPTATRFFYGCYALRSVYMPFANRFGQSVFAQCHNLRLEECVFSDITALNSYALYSVYYLSSANFPSTSFIGSQAFGYCLGLLSAKFSIATYVGTSAFFYCLRLESLDIPAATQIYSWAFATCRKLKEVSAPEVQKVSDRAFISCCGLEMLSFPKASWFCQSAIYSCYRFRALLIGGSSVASGSNSMFGYLSPVFSIYVPDSLVTNYKAANYWSNYASNIVGISAFSGVPSGLTITDIADVSQYDKLMIDHLSDSTASFIASDKFGSCSAMLTATLPAVGTVGYQGFYGCCALESASLLTATNISSRAFNMCYNLENFFAPNVQTIGEDAFASTALRSVEFSVAETINVRAFQYCSLLESVSLPVVSLIKSSVFAGCNMLSDVYLPNVETIKSSAFNSCYMLSEINLPNVKSLGACFRECRTLNKVILSGSSVAYLETSQIFYSSPNAMVYVPDSLVSAYKSANIWSYLSDRIFGHSEIPS